MNIRLVRFRRENSRFIEAYWKLKFAVFCSELGWRLPTSKPEIAAEDEFDAVGFFVGAFSPCLLGVIRGVRMVDAIPYYAMISHHFSGAGSCFRNRTTATITSLAVLPAYRGRRLLQMEDGVNTVAAGIATELFRWLRTQGICYVVANVSLTRAVYFFRKLGFRVIDPATSHLGHPFPVVNMAMSIVPEPDGNSEYLEERESKILGAEGFDVYTSRHAVSREIDSIP
ncbi:MAG: GNAT family N-acetyltransferase [Gammaproteobacteria bacterium]|nr:GNAT family N-acetyltransferase [Gammaproteobacteria bacterium]MDJ0892017.1 GNAT family N-acetyltransferase [Gammaproteobacteria bacterium]